MHIWILVIAFTNPQKQVDVMTDTTPGNNHIYSSEAACMKFASQVRARVKEPPQTFNLRCIEVK